MGQDNHSGGVPPERDQRTGPGQAPPPGQVPGQAPPPPWGTPQPPGAGAPQPPWGTPPPGAGAPQPPWGTPPPPKQPGNPWAQPNPWAQQQGAPQQGGPQQWGPPLQQGGWTPPPKPGVIPLRPLRLGELLDGAFQACRRNAAATFGSALLIQGVVAVLTFIYAAFYAGNLYSTEVLTGDAQAAQDALDGSLTATGLLGLASALGVLMLQGVLVIPIARSILNLKTGFAQAWRLSRTRLLPLAGQGALLAVMMVVGLVIFVLLVVLIIEALGAVGAALVVVAVLALLAAVVWVGVRLALAPAALVLEPAGIFASLGRSWQLTRGNFWRALGVLALTGLLVGIVSSVISTPLVLIATLLGGFGGGGEDSLAAAGVLLALNFAITTFFGAIGYAFQSAVTSLLYVDLRIRREGFDLTLMKEQELVGTADADLVPGRRDRGTPA